MRTLHDPALLLADGLAAIRTQFQIPAAFPAGVEAAAAAAALRAPTAHVDRTALRFVTLDPASSTDLDQAFAIEAAGGDLLLHYAIADVGWFVDPGSPLDVEAWARGATTYLPDGKAPLYPKVLSEQAASLLPDGNRPAVLFTVRIAPDGTQKLDGVERAVVRSRAKLGYETLQPGDLPPEVEELARRVEAAEAARGAAPVDPPEQEVERGESGHFTLHFRRPMSGDRLNAAMSLACNMAVADALLTAHTGLFRVLPAPDARAEQRLRGTARAFRLDWPAAMPLAQFTRRLDPAHPAEAAFMLAVRRAGHGASYAPYRDGELPWHSAITATYVHTTAPLRRLADRYVQAAALAVASGQPVPAEVTAAFEKLPKAMASADARDAAVDRAVIDLAETALLQGQEGAGFDAVVTDLGENGARIQLCDLPVVARVSAHGVAPGDKVRVILDSVDPIQRRIAFTRVS